MNVTLNGYPTVDAAIDKAIADLQDLKITYRHLCDVGGNMIFIANDLQAEGEKAMDLFYLDQKKKA